MPPPGPPRLFAYGTLQPGRLRWPVLAPFATGWRPATVAGTLYDSGHGWPVATFHDDRSGGAGGHADVVPGTLVELDPTRLADALEAMDLAEATATDVLRRIEVTTAHGVQAWAYHCDRAPERLPEATRIDRWDRDDGR